MDAFPCGIGSYRITFSKRQGNDGHPSKLVVVFNSSGIPARKIKVRDADSPFTSCRIDRDVICFPVLQLLSHRNIRDTGSGSQSERSVSTSVSPSPPPDGRHSVSMNQEHTYVKILLQDELWPAPTPSIRLINFDTNHSQSIQLSPTCPPSGTVMSQNRSGRNILPYLSGAIELPSSCALLPQSTFIVYVEGSTSPVHSEVASLKCISSPMQRSGWLYSFDLVPAFWENLCTSRGIFFPL